MMTELMLMSYTDTPTPTKGGAKCPGYMEAVIFTMPAGYAKSVKAKAKNFGPN